MDRSISITLDSNRCIGCGLCAADCSARNIRVRDGKARFANACYGCGHCVAVCPNEAIRLEDPAEAGQVIPYESDTFDIPAENFLNFLKFRRSIRQFRPEVPAQELLEKVIEAGRCTETSSNLQRTGFIVVTERLQELCQMAIDSLRDLGEKTLAEPEKYSPLILGYARNWLHMAQRAAETNDPGLLFFHAPAVILVTSPNPVDAVLASESMELMANALGLGVCFNGFFIRAYKNDPAIKAFLNIPEESDVATCMVIGHPAVQYLRTVPRKTANITWM